MMSLYRDTLAKKVLLWPSPFTASVDSTTLTPLAAAEASSSLRMSWCQEGGGWGGKWTGQQVRGVESIKQFHQAIAIFGEVGA